MKMVLARCSSQLLVTVVLVVGEIKYACLAFADGEAGGTNRPPAVSSKNQFKAAGGSKSPAKAVLPVESAFSRGLDAVGGRFNVYEPKRSIGLRRTTTNCWVMTFHRHAGPDTNAICLIIKDDGSVDGLEGPAGVALAPPDSKIPSPRAMFRKALRSLKGRIDFTEPHGQISFWRSSHGEWDIKLSGYNGLWINGLMLSVSDDLKVTEWTGP